MFYLFGTWYTTYHDLSIATRQGVGDGPEFYSVYLGKVSSSTANLNKSHKERKNRTSPWGRHRS